MTNKFVRPEIAEMEPYVPIVPFEVLSARLGRAPEGTATDVQPVRLSDRRAH